MVRVLNVNHAEIFEWNPETNELRTLAHYRSMVWRAGQEPIINLAERPALRRSLDEKMHVLLTSETAETSKEAERLKCAGQSALLVLPILGGEQAVGLLMAYFIHPLSKSPSPDILQRVQRQGLEIIMHLAENRVSTTATVQRLWQEVNRALRSDWVDFSVVTKDGQALTQLLSVGSGLWLHSPYPTLNLSQYPDIVQALESQTPINEHRESATLKPGAKAILDASGGRSLLGVPLVARGQPQGLVAFVDASYSQHYSSREVDLGRAIVGQSATALENARLVNDLEASLRELKETQARLIQAARLSAMGELAAAVAHQINNPLTTIVVDTELLLLNEPEDSEAHQSLSAVLRAGKRAAGVVSRLLATVRTNTASDPPEAVNLITTIEDTLGLVRAHIERESIKVHPRLPREPLPTIWSVPGELDDVWLNLLLNAHDALVGRDDAEMGIDVRYKSNDDYIEVVVWDNGPGIPAHLLNEVFKPFFTTKPVGEGTGLGLHICRQVIDRVGGSISIESAPDQGTQFFVRLPVMKRGLA
jgi:signal transduction histidine kinase